jgi:uncharacterized protein YecE (DUF72 family)
MLYLGTSGWQYRHWRRVFYPEQLPQRDWLPYYAERFSTVEINNTFYNLPEKPVFEQWKQRTPDDFVFALKMSRFLTHLKRLHDPEEPVQRFLDRAEALGQKLGPVLIQLPPSFHADVDLLEATLATFGKSVRVAVEFRDESWFTDETRKILERRKAALCLADSPRRKQPFWRTADWGFVRFHEGSGGLGVRRPGYATQALHTWVRRIADTWGPRADVYTYFNNDHGGYAIKDAITFASLAGNAGLLPTRVPEAVEGRLAG